MMDSPEQSFPQVFDDSTTSEKKRAEGKVEMKTQWSENLYDENMHLP